MVDKQTQKICSIMKETEIKSLASLEAKTKQLAKGRGYFMWNILLKKVVKFWQKEDLIERKT